MYSTILTCFLAASAAVTTVTAAPAEVELHSAIAARDDPEFSIVSLYSDSSCSNFVDGGRAVYGHGDLGCTQTGNQVGTQVKGQGCYTAFYADPNCDPSTALLVPDSGCYANVAAFTINCP
jgi:hypothetical protein